MTARQSSFWDAQRSATFDLGIPYQTEQVIIDRFWDLPGYAQALIRVQDKDAVITVEWLYQQHLCYLQQARAYAGENEMFYFSRDRADALLCAYDILREEQPCELEVRP